VDTVPFNIVSLQESYVTGVTLQPADAGQYITYRDSIFTGKLNFWEDNSPIVYDGSNPSAHLITNINGNNTNCNNPSLVAVQPDLTGNFTYNTTNGPDITITKNIAPTTSVQPVINGFDVFLTKRVLQNDPAFVPTIFQLIAMDVNLDGVISAGDASQINQRAVLILPEFQQAWNYTSSGVPLGPLSKDWLFVDNSTLNSNPHYRVSLTYPFDDGIGASKYRVPQIPFCLTLPNSSTDTSGNCQLIITESYQGVLLGDINGNYATAASSSFRPNSTDEVVFDLSRSVSGDGYVDVPVSVLSMNAIKSLDFAIGVKEAKLSFNSISVNSSDIESLANYNANDKTLRVTSNSSQNYEIGKPVISVRFNSASGQVTPMELNSVEAFLNGERVAAEIKTDASSDVLVNIFPNPANEQLNVVVPQDANIQLLDASGKVISFMTLSANKLQVLGTKDLASGVYMLKVYNDNFVTVRRVVIQK
jgi:hypothetical protein